MKALIVYKSIEAQILLCYNESTLKQTGLLEVTLMKYVCDLCGWEYDEERGYPEGGITSDTAWEDVPEDFECPMCLVGKDQFSEA